LEQVVVEAEAALESVQLLDDLCQQKFGDDAPGFRILRLAIEDVQHAARMLAAAKRKNEPQPEPEPEPEEAENPTVDSISLSASQMGATSAAPARAPKPVTAEPVDCDDAHRRIAAMAAYLRRQDPYSPAPYMITRGLRWGELRASGGINPDLLEAPSSETRQQLKRFMLDREWDKVLEAAEFAMALPCGRGWLDLQRYAVKACGELGGNYDAISSAIQSALRALLKDLPQLTAMTLLDDTATANVETQAWLAELFPPDPPAPAESVVHSLEEPEPVMAVEKLDMEDESLEGEEGEAIDAYDLALEEARAGNLERAMQMLVQQISQERSGRGRFNRRVQLAQICILSNRHAVAYPLLQDLADEIASRNLEAWEQPEAIAQTLALLFQTMQKLRFGEPEKRKIYSQICRLDPVQAARLAD
jgi:type VI secretion system protein ImpA